MRMRSSSTSIRWSRSPCSRAAGKICARSSRKAWSTRTITSCLRGLRKTMSTNDPVEAEFAALLARSGLVYPEDRRQVLLRCYREVRNWAEVIRKWEKTPVDEPANAYDIRTVTRTKQSENL